MSIPVTGEVRENGRVELYNAVETVNLAELSGITDGPHQKNAACDVCNDTGFIDLFNGPKESPRVECHCCGKGLDIMRAKVAADDIAIIAAPEEPESVGDRLARIARDLERIKRELTTLYGAVTCDYKGVRLAAKSLDSAINAVSDAAVNNS